MGQPTRGPRNESTVRARLQEVADGRLDLWEFADWIDDYSWNMHRDSSESVIALISIINSSFAEYDIHGDESSLRRALDNIATRPQGER